MGMALGRMGTLMVLIALCADIAAKMQRDPAASNRLALTRRSSVQLALGYYVVAAVFVALAVAS